MGELNLGENLYEFNKVQMSQVPPLDVIWLGRHCSEVAQEMINSKSKFWMLLCRERNDYTIFWIKNDNKNKFGADLFETLNNRGIIIDFTKQPDNNYEVWVRDNLTNENFVYYLFDYSNAIVEV